MKELKVTIAGVEYTAPAPRMKEFKEYLKMLRDRERNETAYYDIEFSFIATLFQSPEVTSETLEQADFAEGAILWADYAAWIDQYIPDTKKTRKPGRARSALPGDDESVCGPTPSRGGAQTDR